MPATKMLGCLALLVASTFVSQGIAVGSAGAAATHKPGAPTSVSITAVDGALNVSWVAPISDGGSPVIGYTVTAISKAAKKHAKKSTCATTGGTSCVVVGVENFDLYSITVRARNAKGYGKPSAAMQATPSTTQNCSYIGPYANLQNCNLTGANLTDANLTDANFQNCTLTGTNLTGANLTDEDPYLEGVVSGGIVGTPGVLPADWELVDGYLVGYFANLTGADLENADLAGAQITGADLENADLNGTNLTGAVMAAVSSGGVVGTPASLPSGWELVNGYLIGPDASLNAADLEDANLVGADLDDADLNGADLENADLAEASFMQAYLGGANLIGAVLYDVFWYHTTCPDFTDSNNDGYSCINNL